MQITAPCVVTLSWRLEDTLGNLIDELEEPVEFFYGGDDLLAKVEEAIADQAAGFHALLQIDPEHAFGDYEASLVCFEDRALFPQEIEVGMRFESLPAGCATEGMPSDTIYTVSELYPDHVVLDGNHPLAGIALRLDLTVRDVRAASSEEIERRSVGELSFMVQAGGTEGALRH